MGTERVCKCVLEMRSVRIECERRNRKKADNSSVLHIHSNSVARTDFTDTETATFYNYKELLSDCEGHIVRGLLVAIQQTLQVPLFKMLHLSHLRVLKMKQGQESAVGAHA